jgi:murein DD-endopeptidase MepM/ murein hydrolase activator NlpD
VILSLNIMTKNTYVLPLPCESIKEHSTDESPAHKGNLQHSVDFICDEGTPLTAAADGVVVWLRNDSNEGGDSEKYWEKGNRIVIKHGHGEYTAYEHLWYQGAVVNVGDNVTQKQLIGYSGNTGYSSRPHLHFEVFVDPDEDESEGVTIPVIFPELEE